VVVMVMIVGERMRAKVVADLSTEEIVIITNRGLSESSRVSLNIIFRYSLVLL
jgi:hypothetical protein